MSKENSIENLKRSFNNLKTEGCWSSATILEQKEGLTAVRPLANILPSAGRATGYTKWQELPRVRQSNGTSRPWLFINGQQFIHENCTEVKQNRTKQKPTKHSRKQKNPNPENLSWLSTTSKMRWTQFSVPTWVPLTYECSRSWPAGPWASLWVQRQLWRVPLEHTPRSHLLPSPMVKLPRLQLGTNVNFLKG